MTKIEENQENHHENELKNEDEKNKVIKEDEKNEVMNVNDSGKEKNEDKNSDKKEENDEIIVSTGDDGKPIVSSNDQNDQNEIKDKVQDDKIPDENNLIVSSGD